MRLSGLRASRLCTQARQKGAAPPCGGRASPARLPPLTRLRRSLAWHVAAGAYEASVTLQILDLPMLHPLRLEPGLGAFRAAKQATAEALARPLGARPEGGSGWQRLTMRAKL